MATLTIFTPTYNRAYILPQSYETLKRQNCKDFVWMIVDDGSTDGTEELIQKWKTENHVAIDYYKTPNRGKPSATNLSIEKCKSPLWVCLDSDDYFSTDAVEIILRDYKMIGNDGRYKGIIGNMYTRSNDILDGKELPKGIEGVVDLDIRYKYGVFSNLMRVFYTDILKKYQYPIIPGEKFIGESFLYEKMNIQYYIERKPLYYAEYRSDGLTAAYLRLHVKNPRGYKLLKEQVMMLNIPILQKLRGGIMYVAACKLCGDKHIILNSKKKMLTFIAFPLGMFAYFMRYHKIRKQEHSKIGIA